MKKLCLNIFDYLGLKNREELILLYNSINKSIGNTDPLNRWLIIHLINSLRNQNQIKLDCVKQLIPVTLDSNPYIRRMALLTLINFIKASPNVNLIDSREMNAIICKYFNDPHPIIFGTAFHAIAELKNRDYLNLNFAENFNKFCRNLIYLDEFYLSRAVFSLINFAKLFLFNNIEKNFKYIKTLFDSLYSNIKKCTDFSKNITFISALYEIIVEIDKQNFNVLLKEEFNIFKNKKRLHKLSNILIRLYLSAKNKQNQLILILDLISKFVNYESDNSSANGNVPKSRNTINNNRAAMSNENFQEIKKGVKNYIAQGIFFIKVTDKPFIAAKKLEIIINLVNEDNIKFIFEEFRRNLSFPVVQIKKLIIKAIYLICKKNSKKDLNIAPSNQDNKPISLNTIDTSSLNLENNFTNQNSSDSLVNSSSKISHFCVEKLIDCLKIKEEEIIAQVIVSLRKLVNEIKDHTKYILIYSIKNFKKSISSNLARANIIWMVTQYMHTIPTVSVDFFRRIIIDLDSESDEVKSQIINLAIKLYFSTDFINQKYKTDADYLIDKLNHFIKFTLEKLFYDQNYNIREKARLGQLLISMRKEELLQKIKNKDFQAFEKANDFYFNNQKRSSEVFNYFDINSAEDSSPNKSVSDKNQQSGITGNHSRKEMQRNKNFNLSLAYKLGYLYNPNKEVNEEPERKKSVDIVQKSQFENLFFFDIIEDYIDESFFNISLDEIINLRKGEVKLEAVNIEENNPNNNLTDKDKFTAIKSQEEKVKNTVENFDSKLNIEETRNKYKNQLDSFLNQDNDEDEDEFEVEISKD